MIYRPVPHIIGDIVDMVREKFTEEQKIPYYDYGSAIEVVNRLKRKSNNPDLESERYPLIWFLINDNIKEVVQPVGLQNPRIVQNVTIIICTNSKQDFSSAERYQNTIIPTLRPLYESFMFNLRKSNLFKSNNNYTHNYYENLFWGRDGLYGHSGNITNDKLDAIIIDDLDLRIVETC